MSELTYNLIVRSVNSRNYWAGIQKEAVKRGISGPIVILGAHRVGAANLSQTTLDDTAWKLYSELPQVLQDVEAKFENSDTTRWAFVTENESERAKKKLKNN